MGFYEIVFTRLFNRIRLVRVFGETSALIRNFAFAVGLDHLLVVKAGLVACCKYVERYLRGRHVLGRL